MHPTYAPLVAQLEKELDEAVDALAFWRDQPPSAIEPRPGVIDLSVNRVAELEAEVADTRDLIAKLREWDR